MRLTVIIFAVALTFGACAHDGSQSAETDSSAAAINGEAAYLEHCAGCHETGMLGAPREGHPSDWETRSKLWQAVLMEHARTGYFEMPARGGKTNLPDEIVDAAAEYMLEKTFPNRPKD